MARLTKSDIERKLLMGAGVGWQDADIKHRSLSWTTQRNGVSLLFYSAAKFGKQRVYRTIL